MDEDEFQRIVSGAAGALADTWKKTSDFINNENQSFPWAPRTTVQERYNTPEGSKYWTPTERLIDWVYKNPETAEKIIMGGAAAAAGLPPELSMLSALAALQEFMPDLFAKYGFTPEPLPAGEGRGDESGKDVPTFVPYDPGEFEYGHWTEGLGEPNPEIGGGYGVYGDPELDYYNLGREAIEKGLYPEYSGPEGEGWSTPPEYNVWAYNAVPVIHAEEERKWQLEYDAAKEAFDRRNEEEERRHREEYDKMVADMLAEQELEASMDTDFSMGDLEPDDFWTKLEKFLDLTVYNPIFDAPPYQSQGNPHKPDSLLYTLQSLGESMFSQNAGTSTEGVFGENTRQILDLLQGKPADFSNQNLPPEQVQPQIQYNPTVP